MGCHNNESPHKKEREARKAERRLAKQREREERQDGPGDGVAPGIQPGKGRWTPLARRLSPQGRANERGEAQIDVGGEFQNFACG